MVGLHMGLCAPQPSPGEAPHPFPLRCLCLSVQFSSVLSVCLALALYLDSFFEFLFPALTPFSPLPGLLCISV